MKISEHDFLIIEYEDRLRLVLAEDNKGKSFRLRDKQSIHFDDYNSVIEVSEESLVANLGTNPRPGRAYGVGCEPILRHVKIDYIGDVFFFRRLKKEERKGLLKAMEKAAKIFKDNEIFPYKPFVTFIMPYRKSKMYSGTYHYFKTETRHDELTLFADSYTDKERALYIVLHELAHGMWFWRLDEDMRSDWIEAYNENLDKMKYGGNKLSEIRSELKKAGSIGVYRKTADDDDKSVLDEILRFIKRVYRLNNHNINELLSNGRPIKGIWPSDPVELSKKAPIISEYANESPEEFFAEAMAYHLSGMKMPKSLRKLIESTMDRAKNTINPLEEKHKKE